MKMNRKDFIFIADMIKNMKILDKATIAEVAKRAARDLKDQYSNFDEAKFMDRIGSRQ